MTAAVAHADLRKVALDDLAQMFASDDDSVRRAALAEAKRRDQADRSRRARQAVDAEWYDFAYEQYLTAESDCRGVLLSRRGRAAGIEPFSLWQGPEVRAMAYASEELIEFWQSSPRCTVQRYRDQLAAARRAEADARARDAYDACQAVPMDGTGELPDAATLTAMVRADGPEVLDRFAPAIDELLDSAQSAGWLGIKRGTVYQEVKRNRWPAPDRKFGQSGAWSRRTLILHRAAMVGIGAPGRERAKRKPA